MELRPTRVRLRLSDPELLGDLLAFFRRRESSAERVGPDLVEVEILHTLDERQGQLELDLYLRVWQALHPEGRVEVVDE